MLNFSLGVDANLYNLSVVLRALIAQPIFWGFLIGFIVSTLVHGFLLSGGPKNVPAILLNNPSASFQKIYPQNADGTYAMSFSRFTYIVTRVKTIFALSFLLFMTAVLVACVRFW